MDFKEFQNSIIEAVAEKVKNSKKRRELTPEEKDRRRKVLAENVKKSKATKPKETPQVQKLEPTRVEAVLPSTPVQNMPDFESYFKQINERLDRFENQFKAPKIQQPTYKPQPVQQQAPKPVQQAPKPVQPIQQQTPKPVQPVQQQTPKPQPVQPEPEKVYVYSAFNKNPWSQGPF